MNSIYVLNKSFQIEGIIDEYTSLIWRPSFADIGDFELYMSADSYCVSLLQKDRYIVRSNDITVINGVTTFKKVMIIKRINLKTEVDNGDFVTVTGRELKYLLHQRIVWAQTTLSGTVENGIRQLVNDNAINPSDESRIIPSLVLGDLNNFEETIDKQLTGEHLDTAIIEICNTYEYGWDIYIQDGFLTVGIYKGVDRSYKQNERPYVVFSDNFENLYNTDYTLDAENYASTALIGGEGEGTERKYASVGANKTGLERFEIFVDAKDISQNKNASDESKIVSDTDYIKLLQERGNEKLADLSITEAFMGEVISDLAFKYEVDFFLGDTVTVINAYGISRDVKVISAIESDDESGQKLLPQFNI